MAARIHWPLKIIAFNSNDIWRQRYELSQAYDGSSNEAAVVAEDKKYRRDLSCKSCTNRGLVCSAKE
jgi:hypothetical protein